jgi:protein-disulfide isomerase
VSNERQQRAARAEQMRKEREKADRKQRNVITLAIVAVVIALIAVGGYAINKASNENATEKNVVQPANTTKDFGIVYDTAAAGGKVPAGTKPVSVELYEDFQCPACLQFEQTSNAFLKEQVKSGAITITYRPFSFLDETGGSPNEYSHRSTNIALCVLDQNGVQDYVKVHDYLYQNQPTEGTNGPEDADLVTSLKGLGITNIDDQCVKTRRFGKWIDAAKDAGSERGVSSTPSVYIGGKAVEQPDPANLQKAITAASKS